MLIRPELTLTEIDSLASDVSASIQRAAIQAKSNEADFASRCDIVLSSAVKRAGLEWNSVAERRVVSPSNTSQFGRIDRLLFDRLVVEYEPPGSLRQSNSATTNRHAIKQVRDYLEGILSTTNIKERSAVGLVIDGYFLVFCRFSNGQWIEEAPLEVTKSSVARILRLLLTFHRKPLLPDSILESFGEKSNTTIEFVNALYQSLEAPNHKLTSALYMQWQEFFADIAGLDAESLRNKAELMTFATRVTRSENVDPARLLFSLYTYSAILIKLLSVIAVLPFVSPKRADELVNWPHMTDAEIKLKLENIENGQFFSSTVANFTEGDFFGWYVYEWTPAIRDGLRKLIEKLAEFDPDAVEQAPERVRDIFKRLYHGLYPRQVRHDLGEYYTPDWLAERLLRQMDTELFGPIPDASRAALKEKLALSVRPRLSKLKFIDPTCGSGTFLILIIRTLRMWARECGVNERDVLLPAILNNVTGFDLNPLAVISSKANILLSIADLLQEGDEPIEIPVYLADSISTPGKRNNLQDLGSLILPLRGIRIELKIPSILAERESLSILAKLLTRDVKDDVGPEAFYNACESSLNISRHAIEESKHNLLDLYNTLAELHKEDRDGIWANIAKNMFMPLFVELADYVVGNPPWVNWDSLPQHYRDSSKHLWINYGLFVHKGMDAQLGKSNKDLSMLMTYVAADRYLKAGGKLGFVITQSVFKTAAGEGFRRFQLGNGEKLRILAVDDFSEMQPFESASNRTAVFLMTKGRETTYPVPYTVFHKTGKQSVPFTADLAQAAPLLRQKQQVAEPIDMADRQSSWITAGRVTLKALRKVLGQSPYKAVVGAYSGGANAIYWLRLVARNADGTLIVRNIVERARRMIIEEEHLLEDEYLYPLLRGREVKKWSILNDPDNYFLMVQNPITRVGIDEKTLQSTAPRTYAYLTKYKPVLLQRKSQTIKRLIKKVFYSMFAISTDTFKPYKVVWAEQGDFSCAVCSHEAGKVIIPDHKVMMIALENELEAHYVCGVINSTPFRHAVRSYSIELQQNTHILQRVLVPSYDSLDPVHVRISELSRKAHELVSAGLHPSIIEEKDNMRLMKELESELDTLASSLWGIELQELEAIKVSYREL